MPILYYWPGGAVNSAGNLGLKNRRGHKPSRVRRQAGSDSRADFL